MTTAIYLTTVTYGCGNVRKFGYGEKLLERCPFCHAGIVAIEHVEKVSDK